MTGESEKLGISFDNMDSYDLDLFDELVHFYDIIEQRRSYYEELAEFAVNKADVPEESIVVEGGCKTGLLLNELEGKENVERVVGVDPSESSLSLADDKVSDGVLINGSVHGSRVYSESDLYMVSGETFRDIPHDHVRTICEAAYESLNGEGVFIAQVNNQNMMSDGVYEEEDYDLDGFDANVKTLESRVGEGKSLEVSKITLENRDVRESTVRRIKYYHDHNDLEDALYSAGFARVSFTVKPDFADEENPIVIAWV